MASNQSNNSSSTNIPSWMGQSWHMATVSGSVVNYSHSPNVVFDTSNLTVALYGTTWGSLDPTSVAAAALSSAAVITVKGLTLSGQPFCIDHVGGMLKCYMANTTSQRSWLVVTLGVIAGTLLGGVAGFAAGAPLLGTAVGLIAATTGSLVTARGIPTSGSDHHIGGGGPTPTWVANDTGSGRIGQPGSHPVIKATA